MHETEKERLNRNFDQLLQELRVAIPGVQVLFAFLLVAPFSTRFDLADQFERVVYFVALLFAALSAVLLLAPSIQHRILFRQDEKAYLVSAGTRLSIAGLTALACSSTLAVVLVAHFLYGAWAAAIAGGFAFLAYAVIWYVIPIHRRLHAQPVDDEL